MKKLMVLSLVLAVSAMSSAALSLVDLGGGAVGVNADDALAADFFLAFQSPELTVGGVQLTEAGTGTLSEVLNYGVMDTADLGLALGIADVWYVNTASATVGDILAGIRAVAETDGIGVVTLLNGSLEVVQSMQIVPEPMTMGLLGLGALFLRRRK